MRVRSILRFRWIAGFVVCMLGAIVTAHILLNPAHVNRIVVIKMSQGNWPQYPLTIRLVMEDDVLEQTYGEGSLQNGGGIDVFPWRYAFFSGQLSVVDANGMQMISTRIAPPARYSRNLVIFIDTHGAIAHSYNRLPDKADMVRQQGQRAHEVDLLK